MKSRRLVAVFEWASAQAPEPNTDNPRLLILAIFGAIVGYGFGGSRRLPIRRRLAIVVLVGASVVYFIILWLENSAAERFSATRPSADLLGFHILLGLPFYYLLCFVGIAEESEAEIAGLCTMLGFAIYLLVPKACAALLLPIAIFFVYTVYILPGLKVFKYTLRGYIYSEVGKLRLAPSFVPPGTGTRSEESARLNGHGRSARQHRDRKS